MTTTTWQLILAGAGIVIAFVSSAWVNALSRLTTARAVRLREEQGRRGELLVKISENPRPYLTSTVLVMLLARVASVVLVTSAFLRKGVPAAETIAAAVMIFLLFQLGEVAPRSWVLERPDQVMLFAARPVWFIGEAVGPFTTLLVRINRLFMLILPGRGLPRSPVTSEEEIKSMLEVAEEEEVIESEEAEMIGSIFEFGDTVVREIMVPRPDMVSVDASTPLDDLLDLAMKHGFSRIPVISENIDNIVGVVHIRDVVRKVRNGTKRARLARDVAREPYFVPESKKVIELLREIQGAKTHMAIVVDEYGGTAGLVTLEDVLEEIVGEISDEYDREEPSVEQMEDGLLRVTARLSIDELNQLLGANLPSTEWDSVGGLIGGMLGRVAEEGDSISVAKVTFEVEKVKGRRIEKVLVHPPSPDAAAGGSGGR